MTSPTSVLYLASDRAAASAVADELTDEYPTLSLDVVTTPADAAEVLDRTSVDCIVADDDPAGTTGLAFLRSQSAVPVRVLYTRNDTSETVRAAAAAGLDVVHRTDGGGVHRLASRLLSRSASTPASTVEDGGDTLTDAHLDAMGTLVTDALLTIDESGTVRYANEGLQTLLGYAPEEVVGEHLTTLMTDDLAATFTEAHEQYLSDGIQRMNWDYFELTAVHRQGGEVPLSLSLTEFSHDGERFFSGMARPLDDTDPNHTERELFYRVGRAVSMAESFDEGLETFLRRVCSVASWEYGEVWVPDRTGDRLVCDPAWVSSSGTFRLGSADVSVAPGEGLPGRVWESGCSEWITDFADGDDATITCCDDATDQVLGAAVGIPVVDGDETVAVFVFFLRDRQPRDDRLVDAVTTLARELGGLVVRKRRERQLLQYESMLEAVDDGVYALDADGNFVAVNESYEELTGYSREELIGEHATKVTGTAINEEVEALQAALERGEDVPMFRTMLTSRDGTTTPIEAHVSLFPLGSGESGRIGVVRDVSERERLKSELDEILERVTDAFFALDTDWNFTFVNERAEELIAKSADELVGASVWDKYPEAVGTTFESSYKRAMETQEAVNFEEYFEPLGSWFRVHAYPSETGLSVYFRDVTERKEWEDRLASLNQSMQALLETKTREEVFDIAVDTASESLGLSTAVFAQYDEETGHLVSVDQTMADARTLDDEILASGDGIAWKVFVENEPRVYDSLSETLGVETIVESVVLVPMGRHGVFLAAAADSGVFSENDVSLVDILGASVQSSLDRADREEALRERTEELEAQNESLERLRRINGVIREITGTLTQASTREEIEQEVCNRLTSADPYRFAWVGSPDAITGTVTPQASAGAEQGFLSALTGSNGEAAAHSTPAELAAETLQSQVQNNIHGDPPFEPWREAALKRGYRSSIAVPIVYRDTLYGVLCLYATEPNVFNQMEQTVLTELGEIIGHAFNALERKRALVSEQSVEFDFEVADPLDQPLRFIADLGGTFEYENIVQRSDGFLHLFFTVTDVPADEVLRAGEAAVDVEHISLVSERGDECLFECAIGDATMFSTLLDRGVIPQMVSLNGQSGHLVVRVPQTVDARSVVELLERKFRRADLTARREYDDPVWTQQTFHSEFEDHLTDRQKEVLRTAYFAGFFEWPRESTGEDVAAMLGVSQPTVHRHVRGGERTLFSLLFEGE